MQSDYSVERSQCFVASEDSLEKLIDLIAARIGSPTIMASCADDLRRTFATMKELAAYENPKGKEIRELKISGRGDDYKKEATISFSSSPYRPVSINFSGREDVVTRLREETLDIVGGMRPWYNAIHRVDFVLLSLVSYFLLWGLLLIVIALWMPEGAKEESNPRASAVAQLTVFGGIAILFILGLGLNSLRNFVFPRAVFLIGQGKNRYQHLERVQWGVVIAFVVSFAAGVVVAIWQAVSG